MAFTIDGTNGLTFPDSSSQPTRAVSRSGDTMTGQLNVTAAARFGSLYAPTAQTTNEVWNSATNSNGSSTIGTAAGTSNNYIALRAFDGTSQCIIDSNRPITKPNQPSFMVRRSSVTGVVNPVIWDQVIHNTGNHYNSSTGRFTAPVSGRYLFNLYAMPSGTGYTFYANYGSTVHYLDTVSSGQTGCMSVIVNLSANDTCSVRISGGSINSSNNDNNAWSGFLLG